MKTILITGGTSGIGFSCAKQLIQDGYKVIITGNTPIHLTDALEKLGENARGYCSDAGDLDAIQTLVTDIQRDVGNIDGLFINAGIFQAASFLETSEALFDKTMNVNFKGAFFLVQSLIPILNNPASIVLNTSIVVFKSFAATAAYTASKAALESIAKVLNTELSEKGIRVNVISPGVTETAIQQKAGMSDADITALKNNLAATSPIGRIVQPADIAPILSFLMSDGAWVLRNEKIVVDGGSSI